MKRRGFLKKGLVGAALLAAGGGGLFFFPAKHLATPARALRVLDDRAYQALVAVAERVLPEGADAPEVALLVDESLERLPIDAQGDLRNLLHLFESALAGLLFDGAPVPFTRSSAEKRDAILRSWRDSSITVRRGGYQALRKLCLSAYYAFPPTWKAIGYGGPPDTAGFRLDDSKAGTPAWLEAEKKAKGG